MTTSLGPRCAIAMPLEWLARQRLPDTLAFQVDLWAAPGELPKNVPEVLT